MAVSGRRARTSKKNKAPTELEETTAAIEKRYGVNTVQKGNSVLQPDRISTGVFIMDLALLGGVPDNRSTLFNGRKHGGKSLLTYKLAAAAQRQYPDGTPVIIDTEGTFDETWAETNGIDTDRLIVTSPDSGEMAVDIADALAASLETSLIIVDSLAGLTPTREIDSSAEDAHVGIHAKLITGMCRKLTQCLIKERRRGHKITIVYVNQWRAQIGGFSPGFGESLSQPGGKALEHYVSVQIDIKNKENKGRNREGVESMTHNEHPFRIMKNKMCNGPRTGEFTLVRDETYQEGLMPGDIDNSPTMLSYAKKFSYYTGGGKAQYLEFDGVKMKFGKQDECVAALNQDRALNAHLYWWLIAHQANSLGMKKEFVTRLAKMRRFHEN